MRLHKRGIPLEEPGCEARSRSTAPATDRLRQLARRARAGLGVHEVHDEFVVDRDDALVQPLEEQAQPVALAFDVANDRRSCRRMRSKLCASAPNSSRPRYVSGDSNRRGDRLGRGREAGAAARSAARAAARRARRSRRDHAGAERLVLGSRSGRDMAAGSARRRQARDPDPDHDHAAVLRAEHPPLARTRRLPCLRLLHRSPRERGPRRRLRISFPSVP